MGFFKDLVEPKEKIWEGRDEALYNHNCEILRNAGIRIQAFKVNQEAPKCSGNCGTCASACNFKEDTPIYEKMGSGFSTDLLSPKADWEVYVIYVGQSRQEEAKAILLSN